MNGGRQRPFLDPELIRGQLYGTSDRMNRRLDALTRAKTTGRYTPDLVADLIGRVLPDNQRPLIADLGCARGATAHHLARRFPAARLLLVDLSSALLLAARSRLGGDAGRTAFICADFHNLPLPADSCTAAVAAFCLYHSPQPSAVIAEIARCLVPHGVAVLVTKSADSYRELDELIAAAGLDPAAPQRPSLYATAHSGNLADLAAAHLLVDDVVHETHSFHFADLTHAADYLATSPKYQLSDDLTGDRVALAEALRTGLPDQPVTTSSTVTCVLARQRDGDAP